MGFRRYISYAAGCRNLQRENEQRILARGLQSGLMARFTNVKYKSVMTEECCGTDEVE